MILSKKQLEDAARCSQINCEKCSNIKLCNDEGTLNTREASAQTALVYREMLERCATARICPICGCEIIGDNGQIYAHDDCPLAALLKED